MEKTIEVQKVNLAAVMDAVIHVDRFFCEAIVEQEMYLLYIFCPGKRNVDINQVIALSLALCGRICLSIGIDDNERCIYLYAGLDDIKNEYIAPGQTVKYTIYED